MPGSFRLPASSFQQSVLDHPQPSTLRYVEMCEAGSWELEAGSERIYASSTRLT
jgi:hypothetical protein